MYTYIHMNTYIHTCVGQYTEDAHSSCCRGGKNWSDQLPEITMYQSDQYVCVYILFMHACVYVCKYLCTYFEMRIAVSAGGGRTGATNCQKSERIKVISMYAFMYFCMCVVVGEGLERPTVPER